MTTSKTSATKAAAKKAAAKKPAAIAPAKTFAPSGAPEQTALGVDPFNPALDNDPRAATTVEQNKIELNDPTLSDAEAVQRNLAVQAEG